MIRRIVWLGPILAAGAIDLPATAVFKASLDGETPPNAVTGRVVLVEGPDVRRLDAPAWATFGTDLRTAPARSSDPTPSPHEPPSAAQERSIL